MRRMIWLSLLLLFSACTTATDQRAAAHELAITSAKLQRELSAFATTRTKADVARQFVANDLHARAMSIEAENEVIVDSWGAAGEKHRLDMLKSATDAAEAAAARAKTTADSLARNEQLARETKAKVATRSDELASLQKTLGTLARNDKLRDSFAFYRTFFDEVKKAIDDARKAGDDAAEAAATAPVMTKGVNQ